MTHPSKYNDFIGLVSDLTHPKLENPADLVALEALFEILLVDEVTNVVIKSRPPRFYLFGRSGVGKSSLLNALTGRSVAEVGHITPTTESSKIHTIQFGDRRKWEIVDSRGLFESIPANGETPVKEIKAVAHDLETHNPDLLVHVTTPRFARAGSDEREALEQLGDIIVGDLPPRIVCLNKVDILSPPDREWPPEQNSMTANQIVDALQLVAEVYGIGTPQPLIDDARHRGVLFDSGVVAGIVPTYVRSKPYWNLDMLIELLTNHLPQEARLQFTKAVRRERLMRQLARKQTHAIADTVDRISDFGLPADPATSVLQRYLVALIGSFSGRDLNSETVEEYFDAIGSLGSESSGLKTLLTRKSGVLPSFLAEKSTESPSTQTCMIGRSAEAYFFDGELLPPEEFRDDLS